MNPRNDVLDSQGFRSRITMGKFLWEIGSRNVTYIGDAASCQITLCVLLRFVTVILQRTLAKL